MQACKAGAFNHVSRPVMNRAPITQPFLTTAIDSLQFSSTTVKSIEHIQAEATRIKNILLTIKTRAEQGLAAAEKALSKTNNADDVALFIGFKVRNERKIASCNSALRDIEDFSSRLRP